MRTTTAARNRRIGALGALAAATLLATTACQPEDDPRSAASPSPSASATTAGKPSPSATPSVTATSTNGPACKGDWGSIDLALLPGVRTAKDLTYLKVQEGTWTCPSPDTPVWHAIGPKHEIRLSETAKISVNYPFYDTNVNKPIDIHTFLDKADAAATASQMIFAYKIDTTGTVTKLDQRWKP